MNDDVRKPRHRGGKIGFSRGDDPLTLWSIPLNEEKDISKVANALQERIKELNCLYGVSRLAEKHHDSVENLLGDLVNFLPHSWQFPQITRCRIVFNGVTYKNPDFKITRWRQAAEIQVYNEPAGEIAMFYTEECPAADEGPFLKEERFLLEALANEIGRIAARVAAEQEIQKINRQLTVERKALRETNTALRTVLTKIEEEKQEIHWNIKVNVDKILIPILNALSLQSTADQRKYIELLQTNLEEITFAFTRELSNEFNCLTPTEIIICNMIRNGLRTKEIAKIKGISELTINRHRENIRRKLKITNKDINLATYLQLNNRPD